MVTQTQQAFSIIKAGIDRGVQSGIYKSMEEVMDLIQAYNTLVESEKTLQDELSKQKEKFKSLQEQSKLTYADRPVEEVENN